MKLIKDLFLLEIDEEYETSKNWNILFTIVGLTLSSVLLLLVLFMINVLI